MTRDQRTATIHHVLDSLHARAASNYGRADDHLSRAMTAILQAGERVAQAEDDIDAYHAPREVVGVFVRREAARLRAELDALGYQPDDVEMFAKGRCGRINHHMYCLLGGGLSLLDDGDDGSAEKLWQDLDGAALRRLAGAR